MRFHIWSNGNSANIFGGIDVDHIHSRERERDKWKGRNGEKMKMEFEGSDVFGGVGCEK